MKVFIIHGTGGKPEGNWFPWLKKELEKLDCQVFVPRFPTPENQGLENWLEVFSQYEKQVDENTIFVAHSSGPAFVLSVLERLDRPVKACFFVAAFLGLVNNQRFDELNKTITCRDFNWQKIRENCRKFLVINSNNDPYVSIEKGRDFSQKIGAEFIIVENGGHLNKDAGYAKFPLLLEKVKTVL